jgi:hypothetical protein
MSHDQKPWRKRHYQLHIVRELFELKKLAAYGSIFCCRCMFAGVEYRRNHDEGVVDSHLA